MQNEEYSEPRMEILHSAFFILHLFE